MTSNEGDQVASIEDVCGLESSFILAHDPPHDPAQVFTDRVHDVGSFKSNESEPILLVQPKALSGPAISTQYTDIVLIHPTRVKEYIEGKHFLLFV